MTCVTLLQRISLIQKVANAVVPILQLCLKWLELTVVHECCCCFLLNTERYVEILASCPLYFFTTFNVKTFSQQALPELS